MLPVRFYSERPTAGGGGGEREDGRGMRGGDEGESGSPQEEKEEHERRTEKDSQSITESHREARQNGGTNVNEGDEWTQRKERQGNNNDNVVKEERKGDHVNCGRSPKGLRGSKRASGTCLSFSTSYPKLMRQALNSSGPREPPWSCRRANRAHARTSACRDEREGKGCGGRVEGAEGRPTNTQPREGKRQAVSSRLAA